MFAIQWALIVCNAISCLPAIPAFIYKIDSDKFHDSVSAFFAEGGMPSAKDQPVIKLIFRFLFISLVGIYVLGIFAGIYAPAVVVGYAFATGNLFRVVYIGVKYLDTNTWVLGGFSNQQIGRICVIQLVLGIVIAVCTLVSSQNAEYQAFAADMAANAAAKWGDEAFILKMIFGAGIFFTIFQAPPVIAPDFAWKQFQPVVEKQATDKGAIAAINFAFAFQALAILMTQALVAIFVWYAPSAYGISVWCLIFYTLYYPIFVFIPSIMDADQYGMDRLPFIVFMILNVFLGGLAAVAVFG